MGVLYRGITTTAKAAARSEKTMAWVPPLFGHPRSMGLLILDTAKTIHILNFGRGAYIIGGGSGPESMSSLAMAFRQRARSYVEMGKCAGPLPLVLCYSAGNEKSVCHKEMCKCELLLCISGGAARETDVYASRCVLRK